MRSKAIDGSIRVPRRADQTRRIISGFKMDIIMLEIDLKT